MSDAYSEMPGHYSTGKSSTADSIDDVDEIVSSDNCCPEMLKVRTWAVEYASSVFRAENITAKLLLVPLDIVGISVDMVASSVRPSSEKYLLNCEKKGIIPLSHLALCKDQHNMSLGYRPVQADTWDQLDGVHHISSPVSEDYSDDALATFIKGGRIDRYTVSAHDCNMMDRVELSDALYLLERLDYSVEHAYMNCRRGSDRPADVTLHYASGMTSLLVGNSMPVGQASSLRKWLHTVDPAILRTKYDEYHREYTRKKNEERDRGKR